MGKTASNYAKKRLSGKSIELQFKGKRQRGKYGRLLGDVFVDGENFNLELVRQGLSPYYTKYGKSLQYDQQFKDAEKLARKEHLNIWGDSELSKKYLRQKSKWGQSDIAGKASQTYVPVEGVNYVGNKKSKKFHLPDCRWALKISQKNRVEFRNRQDAIDQGYVPGKSCKP